jgi:hypothetical protein
MTKKIKLKQKSGDARREMHCTSITATEKQEAFEGQP